MVGHLTTFRVQGHITEQSDFFLLFLLALLIGGRAKEEGVWGLKLSFGETFLPSSWGAFSKLSPSVIGDWTLTSSGEKTLFWSDCSVKPLVDGSPGSKLGWLPQTSTSLDGNLEECKRLGLSSMSGLSSDKSSSDLFVPGTTSGRPHWQMYRQLSLYYWCYKITRNVEVLL